MSNSPLINYTKISPNSTNPRNHIIDTITIHCMAGNHSVEKCGDIFAPTSRGASSNYGVDSDGRIGMYVEEKNRSWCSSSSSNDNRAVTIEVANDGLADTGWHVSDKALASLINLVADICKRNNIKELKWKADKSLIGQIDKQNMTVHRWFANKACPGDYLYNLHGKIAEEVNKKLNTPISKPVVKKVNPYKKPTDILKFGSEGEAVKWLQYELLDAKINKVVVKGKVKKLTIDGGFGTITEEAVKVFQANNKLKVDGVVGDNTIKALISK